MKKTTTTYPEFNGGRRRGEEEGGVGGRKEGEREGGRKGRGKGNGRRKKKGGEVMMAEGRGRGRERGRETKKWDKEEGGVEWRKKEEEA